MKKIISIALLFILAFTLSGCDGIVVQHWELNPIVDDLQGQINLLEQRIEELEHINDELNDTLELYDSYFNTLFEAQQ